MDNLLGILILLVKLIYKIESKYFKIFQNNHKQMSDSACRFFNLLFWDLEIIKG